MRIGARISSALTVRMQWQLSKLISIVIWLHLRSRRKIIAANLQICYPNQPPEWRAQLLRQNVFNTVMGIFELLRAWYADDRWFTENSKITGLDKIQSAFALDKGVLLFTGHFMHSELSARAISVAMQRRVRGVVRRNNSVCFERFLEHSRAQQFGPTLEKKDVRGMLKILRAGEMLMLSADQNFNYQHSFVPFFGIQAATLNTTPEIIERANAVMLPMWAYRDASGTYHIRIEDTWPQWSSEQPEQSAALYMSELEKHVREHPEQYLWMHRRFKTRPTGESGIY